MDKAGPTTLRIDHSATLQLEALRPIALRAGRLAETLFDTGDADVIVPRDGAVWRGRATGEAQDDLAAVQIALSGEEVVWGADTHLDPGWRHRPLTNGETRVRFSENAIVHQGRLDPGVDLCTSPNASANWL